MTTDSPHYIDKRVQEQLCEIYLQYHNSIKGFVANLETLQNRFPVEILNEIRAVFSHIAKIYAFNDEAIIFENLEKARGHVKRAQLDAYKYLCYAFSKEYNDFRDMYKDVDLYSVNNGEFINQLRIFLADSKQKLSNARRLENEESDASVSYNAYEEAYLSYGALYNLINENMEHIDVLQQREQIKQEKQNKVNQKLLDEFAALKAENEKQKQANEREKKKNFILTCVSIGLGILSIILGIVAL